MKLVEAILSDKIKVIERWGVSHVWLRDSMSCLWCCPALMVIGGFGMGKYFR